jgi:putative FmdB family regulatory protein
MPIYEYRCEECGEPFEVFVRSSLQQTDLACPKCGGRKVKKAVSLFGVGRVTGNSTSGVSCSPGST